MSDEEATESQLTDDQKIEIAKWFILNSPAGEIQYVAKDIKAVLKNESLYNMAAAFPMYNKAHMICLEFPDRSGEVLLTSFSEIGENAYLDPRTAQVAIVDHVKQVCEDTRPANCKELPSPYIEEYRCALDGEISKYASEAYPKGVCSVYCTNGKDVEEPGLDFELVVVISATRHSPQNFWTGLRRGGLAVLKFGIKVIDKVQEETKRSALLALLLFGNQTMLCYGNFITSDRKPPGVGRGRGRGRGRDDNTAGRPSKGIGRGLDDGGGRGGRGKGLPGSNPSGIRGGGRGRG